MILEVFFPLVINGFCTGELDGIYSQSAGGLDVFELVVGEEGFGREVAFGLHYEAEKVWVGLDGVDFVGGVGLVEKGIIAALQVIFPVAVYGVCATDNPVIFS